VAFGDAPQRDRIEGDRRGAASLRARAAGRQAAPHRGMRRSEERGARDEPEDSSVAACRTAPGDDQQPGESHDAGP